MNTATKPEEFLERDIQGSVVSLSRRHDVTAHKFASEARRNVPDYLFLYQGRILFIEFKATGKKARDGQLKEHKKLREAGFDVFVIDDKQAGKALIEDFVANAVF